MMSQLSLLAIVLCLPLGCLGVRDDPGCDAEFDRVGRVQEGINNYKAYKVPNPPVAGSCDGLVQTCEATIIPADKLRGRTWFITNIRPNFGLNYDADVVHDFRVQCPDNTYLHLYIQDSSLPPPAPSCLSDFVTVQAEGLSGGEVTFCGDNNDVQTRPEFSDLYNNGRGRLFPDGKASISFCSDGADDPGGPYNGFVMRASCFDPAEYQVPGCVDYNFFRAWDREFVDLIFDMFPPPAMVELPHKKRRSVSEAMTLKRMLLRSKRFFTGKEQRLDLIGGDTITYSNRQLVISLNTSDDSARDVQIMEIETMEGLPPGQNPITISNINTLNAFNSVVKTREFRGSAPLTFFGPAILLYEGGRATLIDYTIPQDQIEATFLPGQSEMEAANAVYEYIFNNWVFPYPVVDNIERRGMASPIFPLPPGNMPPRFEDLIIDPYRSVDSLGFIQEDIQSGNDTGNCMRAIRIELAPSIKGRIPNNIVRFCQFFDKSCDLALRTACRELLRLDPLSVGK